MMLRLMLAWVPLFAACTDNGTVGPDAGADAVEADAAPDACVATPTEGCCSMLPDEDAVRQCIVNQSASGACGVAACVKADCSVAKINFCAP